MLNASAKDFFTFKPMPDDDPAPQVDSPEVEQNDPRRLRFPINDRMGDGRTPGAGTNPMDLQDPANVKKTYDYDPNSKEFSLTEKIGDQYFRYPSSMTMDEYLKYKSAQDEAAYWKKRGDALSLLNSRTAIPQLHVSGGAFDRIFGGSNIDIRPQGNVDLTFGGLWQNLKNPALVQRAQRYGIFDFDMQMNINLVAKVGEKLKLNFNYNTKANFDFENQIKLEYTGFEDEIIKKIEAGNVSFPLKSRLITGTQSLLGIKTQLQFGRLMMTNIISQQKSKRESVTLKGGAQTQTFSVASDSYDENRHFLLAQHFRSNYNYALKDFPVLRSQANITKVEVWITNKNATTTDTRDIVAFMDFGEKNPYNSRFLDGAGQELPDNKSNTLYQRVIGTPGTRSLNTVVTALSSAIGLQERTEFMKVLARKLNPSEFSFNPQLGFISLNQQLQPDEVLGVSYQYTYNGKIFQVGEFSQDLPPDSTNAKVLFVKMLKSTQAIPTLPIWDLMMKNVYSLNAYGITQKDFRLNIFYLDPGAGKKRYLPEGPSSGTPLLSLLNLDRLNNQKDPQPDGVFDYVEGITINPQQGKVIFPVLEPFGSDLAYAFGNDPKLLNKYLYQVLYDSTKVVAQQFPQYNRYLVEGSFSGSSNSEIYLGGFNIPQGSVSVTAGGQKLVEGVDYQIDYSLGRVKILNTGVLNSGIPINIQYENNATFGFQQQSLMGSRLDYYVNDKLMLGGTVMRLSERPFTQKVSFGEDPINNTVVGLDANYNTEIPALTRLLDKLPIYSTTAPSVLTTSGEVARLFPGHSKLIGKDGNVYIDDFEGTRSSFDMKYPYTSWALASTPRDAPDASGKVMFPEAALLNNLDYGKNRARLAWYTIDPSMVDRSANTPPNIKNDLNQLSNHYVRAVSQREVFPQKNNISLQDQLQTFDLAYYPKDRGQYNFDASNIDANGKLTNPSKRWGGLMRPLEYSDFEASNIEFVEFWVLDPFIYNTNSNGGYLYLNLGNVSEDILKDSRKLFENGLPNPADPTKIDSSRWGNVPKYQQQITRSFDNDPSGRRLQDVGYDGMSSEDEQTKRADFLGQLGALVGTGSEVYLKTSEDPASDNFRHFRDPKYTEENAGILARYKYFNNPEGNSPVTDNNSTYSLSGTNLPESEDINGDNTLNETEEYYNYRIHLTPNMAVGQNNIINIQESKVKLVNGTEDVVKWYQFRVPVKSYDNKVGSISDFRSIRFFRMFMTGFEDSAVLRFARLDLLRNQWRRYQYSLNIPGEMIPIDDNNITSFNVGSVSLEENGQRSPIPYVVPPGIDRQQQAVSTGQTIQLNEQSLSMQVCNLQDGDARSAIKTYNLDMRQFKDLRMFIHAESVPGQAQLKDNQLYAFIRLGNDYTNNYYEYQVPLKISPPGESAQRSVWPEANEIMLALNKLVNVKLQRNSLGYSLTLPYTQKDEFGNNIVIVGNPNVGDVRSIMLGVLNPKDDGAPQCTEVWFNELRVSNIDESGGWAATGSAALQMADLGNVRFSGNMHTAGYGNLDQKAQQRFRDNFNQYDISANINAGKLLPQKWGVQLPVFAGYTQSVSNPEFDPYDLDVKFSDKLNSARTSQERDSMKKAAQDFIAIQSLNFQGVRITPAKAHKKNPFSLANFDLSYSYNKQFHRSPLLESETITQHQGGFGYNYAPASKYIEPFKRLVKSKSKYLALIRDFNVKLLPSSVSFRTELVRQFGETILRNIDDGNYKIPATYNKYFTWNRTFSLRWELTKSLSFDYNASNLARVDEPNGRIDTKEKKDTLWNNIARLGRPTAYNQTFGANYTLPLAKIPFLDWTNARIGYTGTYNYTAASFLSKSLGNTIGNGQTVQLNAEANFLQLYNKNRYLKAINTPAYKPPVSKSQDVKKDDKKVDKLGKPLDDKGAKPAPEPKAEPAKADPEKSRNSLLKSRFISDTLRKLIYKREDGTITKAEKKYYRKLKREIRKKELLAKRNKPIEINPGVRLGGRLLMSLRRATVSYSEAYVTTLPGYMDSSRILGMNPSSWEPGLPFVLGYQPDQKWLDAAASRGVISGDSLVVQPIQQRYNQSFNITAALEPLQDVRIDLNWNKTFSKNYSELFKDTLGNGTFSHLNPYDAGSFSVTYVAIGTMFDKSGKEGISNTFRRFEENRKVISDRLGRSNPYTNGLAAPEDPEYKKGYTRYSQEVLIPAFLSAYTNRDPVSMELVDSKSRNLKDNPFKNIWPMPNWRVNISGVNKLPMFRNYIDNMVITHAYTGNLSMNSFNSNLIYQDIYVLGYPSFIDSNSHNYVPYFLVPNITITESFSPLFGVDATFSKFTARFEYRKARTLSLSLIDFQLAETKSNEYVVGAGIRARNVRLPFTAFGLNKMKPADVNFKMDISVRDDITSNNRLDQDLSIPTRGQTVIGISPTLDYVVSNGLTIRFYYDRRQTIPKVSTSFPITTTRAGVTLRFLFGQ